VKEKAAEMICREGLLAKLPVTHAKSPREIFNLKQQKTPDG